MPVEGCGLVPGVGEDFANFALIYARVYAHMREASGSLGEGKVPPEEKIEEIFGKRDGLGPRDSLTLHLPKKLVGWML